MFVSPFGSYSEVCSCVFSGLSVYGGVLKQSRGTGSFGLGFGGLWGFQLALLLAVAAGSTDAARNGAACGGEGQVAAPETEKRERVFVVSGS